MSYSPNTDFLALLRTTGGGSRFLRMPGLDYVVQAMARANMFTTWVGQTPPVVNVETTVWVKPAFPNAWAAEASIFIYNTVAGEFQPATPALWSAILGGGSTSQIVQTVTTPGPVNILVNANIVLVNQAVSAPITLIMPESAFKTGEVLVSDWKGDASANNITVQMSGTNKLPGNNTSWTISADCGSIMFRPVPGGYVI
jgi:hypothetical protein